MFSACQSVTQSIMLRLFCFLPVLSELTCLDWRYPFAWRCNWGSRSQITCPHQHSGARTGPRGIHPLWEALQGYMSLGVCASYCHCLSHPTWGSCSTGFPYRAAAGLPESATSLSLLWTFCLQHLTKPHGARTEGSSHTFLVACCLFLEPRSSKDHQVEV